MFFAAMLMWAQASAGAPATELPGWMAGCWVAENEGSRSEECWTVPRGEMMLGSNQTFRGERTLSFEHMRIERVDGGLVYIAQPGGEPPTRFMLQATRVGRELRDGLLFVNIDNGYPQRILYWREGDDLLAEIAFIDGRETVRWTFRRPGRPA